MNIFNTSIDSPISIIFTILWFIASAIDTFDIRLNQSEKTPGITMTEAVRRSSEKNYTSFGYAITSVVSILTWILFIIIFLLNPLYAVVIFVIRFILKVLPVMETIGGWIMKPFMKKRLYIP